MQFFPPCLCDFKTGSDLSLGHVASTRLSKQALGPSEAVSESFFALANALQPVFCACGCTDPALGGFSHPPSSPVPLEFSDRCGFSSYESQHSVAEPPPSLGPDWALVPPPYPSRLPLAWLLKPFMRLNQTGIRERSLSLHHSARWPTSWP